VVKQSFVKSILKTNSPKKLMKLLGLRSIDSVIKRANINEFLALAYAVENEAWLTKLHNSYKKLRAGDLQSGVSTLFVISSKNWEKLSASEHKSQVLVRPVPEIGAILITPAKERFPGDSLSLVLAIIEALSELRMYSAYFRHISVQNDLGLKFSDALHRGLPSLPASGYAVSWRDFQRYLSADEELFDEIRQPHFQMEDLRAPSGIETLAKHFDQIKFWQPLEGVFHDDPKLAISCHLIDVLAAAANDKEPEHVPLDYMRAKLWENLGSKYLSEKYLQSEILKNIV